MNKKMRDLRAKIAELFAKAKVYREDGEIDKANGTMDEIEALEKEYALEARMFEAEKKAVDVPAPTAAPGGEDEEDADDEPPAEAEGKKSGKRLANAIKSFAAAARRGFVVNKSMNEGTGESGGYTVPEDIQTQINQYRDASFSLRDLVRVEKVSTNTGARTFQKKSDQTGFVEVAEGGKIGKKATPLFERIVYAIKKFAGFFAVTDELLADSDANITSTITEWIGGESRATDNRLILGAIATKEPVAFADLDDIKYALNVTLGQAYKDSSVIVTNDSGLQYLDTLKNEDLTPVLAASPADPMKLVIAAGATTVPVRVLPNKVLKNDGTKVPFIVGDLYEGIALWDREQTTIKATEEGAAGDFNAFDQDMTLFRAVVREDVTVRDADAFVNGYINVEAA